MALKLDALAKDRGRRNVNIRFDEIDKSLAERYRSRIATTRSPSAFKSVVRGWDPNTSKPVYGSIEMAVKATSPVDVHHVGDITVIGKSDPLVLATDIVANSLLHHLNNLAEGSPLNQPGSIEGWALSERVNGARKNAIEDLI